MVSTLIGFSWFLFVGEEPFLAGSPAVSGQAAVRDDAVAGTMMETGFLWLAPPTARVARGLSERPRCPDRTVRPNRTLGARSNPLLERRPPEIEAARTTGASPNTHRAGETFHQAGAGGPAGAVLRPENSIRRIPASVPSTSRGPIGDTKRVFWTAARGFPPAPTRPARTGMTGPTQASLNRM
jgi:hypothetical protein